MPKSKMFLISDKDPALRYEVVKFDAETQTATLSGRYGPFDVTPFTKAKVTKDGYRLVIEEPEHA